MPRHATTITRPQRQMPRHATTITRPQRQMPRHATTITRPQHQMPRHATTITRPQHQMPRHATTITRPQRQMPRHATAITRPQRTRRSTGVRRGSWASAQDRHPPTAIPPAPNQKRKLDLHGPPEKGAAKFPGTERCGINAPCPDKSVALARGQWGSLRGKETLGPPKRNTKTNAHGDALWFLVTGPSLLQRLAVGGWRLAVAGNWCLAVAGGPGVGGGGRGTPEG